MKFENIEYDDNGFEVIDYQSMERDVGIMCEYETIENTGYVEIIGINELSKLSIIELERELENELIEQDYKMIDNQEIHIEKIIIDSNKYMIDFRVTGTRVCEGDE